MTAPSSTPIFAPDRGVVLWLTGFSGAGKSTLAEGLHAALRGQGIRSAIIDGDVLRTGLSRNLGFSEDDRRENIRRAGEVALHLADAGVVAIVALISPFRADRAAVAGRAKERGIRLAEIFVNAPLAECERRDPKSLYRRARAGNLPQFTGIDSPYESPAAPALELRTDLEAKGASVKKLSAFAVDFLRGENA